MKAKSGKYLFVGNINSLFGPGLRYSNTLGGLRLNSFEKEEIRNGYAALFASCNNQIVRINNNGKKRN